MYKLDETDLLSLEMDIASIRHAGSVEEYMEKRNGARDPIIGKLERLLAELKAGTEE